MLCQTNEFTCVSRPDLILLHLIQIHVSAISEMHCSLSCRETAFELIHHYFCKTASDIHTRNAVFLFNDIFNESGLVIIHTLCSLRDYNVQKFCHT